MDDYSIDPNKIAAEYLIAKEDQIVSAARQGFMNIGQTLRRSFAKSYENYLAKTLERYSMAKSFLFRSEPIPLYDFYIPAGLQTETRQLPKAGIAQVVEVSPRVVISGLGGSGKSLLMRHLLIDCVIQKLKTPVFVELRELNGTSMSLGDALLKAMAVRGLEVDDRYLQIALKAGQFCLMLDGYDELFFDRRAEVLTEINDIAERFPGNYVIVSTRPDSEVAALESFVHMRISPLNLQSAVDLVSRLPFDEGVTARFIDVLKRGTFETHESFLSNPLLLTIMLLTYCDSAQIPDKLSLFYRQAYESLFNRHDLLKSRFQRQHRTQLDIRDFAAAFAAFSLLSYDERRFTMPADHARELFEKSKPLCQLEYDTADIIADAEQAVCLLIEDGLDITFAHRSFQEYFAARYVVSVAPEYKKKLIERFAPHVNSDAVMSLLYEMDRRAVEDWFILPLIARISDLTKVDGRTFTLENYRAYLSAVFSEARVGGGSEGRLTIVLENSVLFDQIAFTLRLADQNGYVEAPEPESNLQGVFAELSEIIAGDRKGDWTMPFTKVVENDDAVRLLAGRSSLLGVSCGQRLLDFAHAIHERQAQERESLEDILTTDLTGAME